MRLGGLAASLNGAAGMSSALNLKRNWNGLGESVPTVVRMGYNSVVPTDGRVCGEM